jgi:2-iminobutanoate/2-iminopropanoate deaminase
MKTKIDTNKAPKATGPFSQAILQNNLVFTSGQIGLTTEGKLLDGSIKEQTIQVMNNLKAVLNKANCDFGNIVKTTIYVTDMSVYGEINGIYASFMKDPFPAREVIGVKELPLGARVEISMIAIK